MKRIIFTVVALLGTSCVFFSSCKNGQGQGTQTGNSTVLSEQIVQDIASEVPAKDGTRRVYSCAFDGYVNIRKAASSSSEKIGKFNNGPEGAVLLEELGDWVKVDVSGVVGYVPSKYVQEIPTVAYTGKADANWVEGKWGTGDVWSFDNRVEVYNNGAYRYWHDSEEACYGKWILQDNAIKFIPTWVYDGMPVLDTTLEIKMGADMLGEYKRIPFEREFWDEDKDEIVTSDMEVSAFRKYGRELLRRVEKETRLTSSSQNPLEGYEWLEGEWVGQGYDESEVARLVVTKKNYDISYTEWGDDDSAIPIVLKERVNHTLDEPFVFGLSQWIAVGDRRVYFYTGEFSGIELKKVSKNK